MHEPKPGTYQQLFGYGRGIALATAIICCLHGPHGAPLVRRCGAPSLCERWRRTPFVANVRGSLFVVSLRADSGDESVCLVEASGSQIALEGPEFEPCRTKPFCLCDQNPADARPGHCRIDIDLIDLLAVQDHQRNEVTMKVSDPDLAGGNRHFVEPLANFLVAVDGWRNR